ncbi:hypothetical protein BKA83DRAFT_4130569 [Pisolithus microcarpus]|nr:hypothetical protein BKA83DRAFT_4130569 [Pisolithus microcarpus]
MRPSSKKWPPLQRINATVWSISGCPWTCQLSITGIVNHVMVANTQQLADKLARLVATSNFLRWEDSSWPGSSASFEAHLGITRRIIALKSVTIAIGITHEIGALLAENPPTALDKSPVVV